MSAKLSPRLISGKSAEKATLWSPKIKINRTGRSIGRDVILTHTKEHTSKKPGRDNRNLRGSQGEKIFLELGSNSEGLKKLSWGGGKVNPG